MVSAISIIHKYVDNVSEWVTWSGAIQIHLIVIIVIKWNGKFSTICLNLSYDLLNVSYDGNSNNMAVILLQCWIHVFSIAIIASIDFFTCVMHSPLHITYTRIIGIFFISLSRNLWHLIVQGIIQAKPNANFVLTIKTRRIWPQTQRQLPHE